jgi:hypothetical protein
MKRIKDLEPEEINSVSGANGGKQRPPSVEVIFDSFGKKAFDFFS